MSEILQRTMVAEVDGAAEADRAGDLGRDVRQDVTVQIRHDDDIEHLGSVRQAGGADVDDPAVALNVGVVGADLLEDLAGGEDSAAGEESDEGRDTHTFPRQISH